MVQDVATVQETASLRQADTDFVGVAINLLEQIEESEPLFEDEEEEDEEVLD